MAQAPGSMTSAMAALPARPPRESWLRIGVVRAGTIVEERWVRPGCSLTWGRSEHADVVVAAAAHDRADLIRATERGWQIVGDGIRGRASRGGETLDLAAGVAIDVDDGSRARIEIGDAIVLVERRARPPERAGTTLPGSLRGALGIDERFTAIVLGSLCLHAAFLLVAGEIDAPYESALERLRTHDAELIYPEPEIPEIATDERATPDGPELATDEPPSSTEHASSPVPRAAPSHAAPSRAAPSAAEIAGVRDEALDAAEHMLLGALDGSGGAVGDLLRRGAPTMSGADLLAVVGGDTRASLDPSSFGAREGGAMTLEGLDRPALEPRRTAAREEGHGPIDERRCCSGIVHPASPPDVELGPGGELPVDVLAREIARRRRRVQVCYEHALSSEPELAGRLVLQLRVEPTGTLSRVRVGGGSIGSDAFHACVVRALDGFRASQPPEGGAVDVAFPFVFAPQR